MRFIKNSVVIPLYNNEYLLINTLLGLLDIITEEEFAVVNQIKGYGEFRLEMLNKYDMPFINQLMKRYYIMDSVVEAEWEKDLLSKLKEEDNFKKTIWIQLHLFYPMPATLHAHIVMRIAARKVQI